MYSEIIIFCLWLKFANAKAWLSDILYPETINTEVYGSFLSYTEDSSPVVDLAFEASQGSNLV